MVDLLVLVWFFNTAQPAQSTLTPAAPQAEFAGAPTATNGFTVKFTVHLKRFEGEQTVLEIPGVLGVRLRQNDPGDRNRQNYPAFKLPDGSVPVLEATLTLHSVEHPDWKEMTIGIPLALLERPAGKHDVVLNFSGVRWTLYVDGDWRCVSPDFPPGGDCTFFFGWGKFDYVIGGFTGLWMKPADAPDSAYQDVVRQGLDFYDGSNVPSITEVAGGRFLMAAWVPIRGWGGNLLIRELLQLPDGRIGSKWMKEITPATGRARTLAERMVDTAAFVTDEESFLLVFDARPAHAHQGKLGISLLPEEDGAPTCELLIRLDERRAQFGPASTHGFAAREKSLREGGAPHGVGNYAIENLIGVDQPFTVRMLVKGCNKIGGSLVDAEIAGRRTMLSYRPGLSVRKLVFRTEGVELEKVQIAPLKN